MNDRKVFRRKIELFGDNLHQDQRPSWNQYPANLLRRRDRRLSLNALKTASMRASTDRLRLPRTRDCLERRRRRALSVRSGHTCDLRIRGVDGAPSAFNTRPSSVSEQNPLTVASLVIRSVTETSSWSTSSFLAMSSTMATTLDDSNARELKECSARTDNRGAWTRRRVQRREPACQASQPALPEQTSGRARTKKVRSPGLCVGRIGQREL